MSFFAGLFTTSQANAVECAQPGLRAALRLDMGARAWQDPSSQGVLVQFQSVVTPEDRWERLPFVFEHGRRALVFDGRLDNREDLTHSLRLRGEDAPVTDSSIAAAAIEKWDEEACRHLVGDFAFACWDIGRRRLILACDQVGGRVIFYHSTAEKIVFATSVDAMLAFPGLPRDIDMQCIARLLVEAPPEMGKTPFRAIAQLPAAHSLAWSARGAKLNRYWTPVFATSIRYAREAEYVNHARDLLDEAVRCRLRAVGPVACQLSGGLDSTGVTATAARLLAPGPVFSVTALPQTDAPLPPASERVFLNERENAATVAAMYPNLHPHMAPAPPPAHTDARVLFHARGMPVRNFLNVAWFGTADRMVRDLGAKALLIGKAGNLTLSWYGISRLPDLVANGKVSALRREVVGLARQGLRRPWGCVRQAVVPAIFSPKLRWTLRRVYGSSASWLRISAISPEFAAAAAVETLLLEATDRVDGLSHDGLARLGMLENMWRRPASALLRPYYGVERRDPLGDVRLVEFCLAIPPEQFLLNGVTRRLARRVLSDRVPAQVLRENRIGRQCPDWFHRLSYEREQLAATLGRLERSPLASYALDLRRMKNILRDWPSAAAAAQPKYCDLVNVLSRGANMGEFLEWVEGGCVPPA